MGSLGWGRCYWCSRWQYNMYIPDPIGYPLCDQDDRTAAECPDALACIDRYLETGKPHIDAIGCHVKRMVDYKFFPVLPQAALEAIASNLQYPGDPAWRAWR